MTCETRIDGQLESVLDDLRAIMRGNGSNSLCDYGLSFDYVPAFTFDDQREAYFRYQLSWGGPSDEFRFFVGPDLVCHRIEYWFLDWFDGACRTLDAQDEQLLLQIWNWFFEAGSVMAELSRAGAA